MASRIITTLVDDIDGDTASETIRFSLDGVAYEIDLNDCNATELRATLGDWVEKARRTGGSRNSTRPVGRRNQVRAVGESRSALIRAWAAREGLAVPARGRIPNDVQRRYDEAH